MASVTERLGFDFVACGPCTSVLDKAESALLCSAIILNNSNIIYLHMGFWGFGVLGFWGY